METKPLDDEAQKKQQAFWERARKGVLTHLIEKGGKLPMGDLHEFSMSKFLIQHQRFSQMMESFVNDRLIEFDWETQEATITGPGKEFVSK